jgi:hypothetical protein
LSKPTISVGPLTLTQTDPLVLTGIDPAKVLVGVEV